MHLSRLTSRNATATLSQALAQARWEGEQEGGSDAAQLSVFLSFLALRIQLANPRRNVSPSYPPILGDLLMVLLTRAKRVQQKYL